MTLDEFIERLEALKPICGGDAPVVIETEVYDHGGEYEIAMAEVQNVMPETEDVGGERTWKTSRKADQNTLQVLSIK